MIFSYLFVDFCAQGALKNVLYGFIVAFCKQQRERVFDDSGVDHGIDGICYPFISAVFQSAVHEPIAPTQAYSINVLNELISVKDDDDLNALISKLISIMKIAFSILYFSSHKQYILLS